MAEKRNGYLVSKALKTFMFASILAALAQQLATTTDAIVVSHLIGPDAISAVNMVNPVMSMCNCLAFLFGMGGSIVAAKAMGRRDTVTANRVFTAAVAAMMCIGIVVAIAGYCLAPEITGVICPVESRIYQLTLSYLRTIILGAAFLLVGFTLQNFVKTDGNPRLVTVAVMSSTLLNFVLDIVFIKVFDMGIAGSAWATVASYVLSLSICLIHFHRPHHSLQLDLSFIKGKWSVFGSQGIIVKEGFPMSVNSFLLGLCIFGFNSIVIHTLGADGMYVWSVCLQLFLITQMVMAGIGSSLFSIGGLLAGERDMLGLAILFRRVMIYICGVLLALMIVVMVMPEEFGKLFGSSAIDVGNQLNVALCIFSLMLIPYSIVANLRVIYQILGYQMMSVFFSIAQLVVMVLFVWVFALLWPEHLWWGFPASAVMLLIMTLLVSWYKHRQKPDAALVTLIPTTTEGEALNVSVRLTHDDVDRVLEDIAAFLMKCRVDHTTAFNISLCCEELMNNIVRYAVKKNPEHHFIDVHIRCTESVVSVLLKDDGRPFNPTLVETSEGIEHLGLRLVNGTNHNITYKYMYDQNMVYMTFGQLRVKS
ncbi:MAG: ATP-binding protein [Prevotella sp.]|nr:ATP-binding protein [Prevotella sp.]